LNQLALEAYNHQNELVGSASIGVTSSLPGRPLQDFLRITEINYHAFNPTPSEIAAGFVEDDDFEFIDLVNTGSMPLDLTGVRFTQGIEFDFTSGSILMLGPGEHVLVVEDIEAFGFRYGTQPSVAGEWNGGLSADGETIVLVDSDDAVIHSFTYDDANPWPEEADGQGPTLEVVDTEADYNDPENWRRSSAHGGSPGTGGVALAGDMDADGDRDANDSDLLALALNDPATYGTMFGVPASQRADFDQDGDLDFDDIAGFVALLLRV
jgi:hypothetical protein